jgi:hypothetical protein
MKQLSRSLALALVLAGSASLLFAGGARADEVARGGRKLDDPGQLREITMHGPRAVDVAADAGSVATRGPAEPADPRASATSASAVGDDDVTTELAARQMRRYRSRFDGCVAAAQRRSDKATGTVMLAFEIANRRVTHVAVRDDGVHDPALARCLVDAGSRLGFSLASARFAWPVTITPLANPIAAPVATPIATPVAAPVAAHAPALPPTVAR